MLKEQRGVSLVALVLLVIVLLILSGISIVVVLENNNEEVQIPKAISKDEIEKEEIAESKSDAKVVIQLIFELLEADYQKEIAKGNVVTRSEIFSASNILQKLKDHNITGNTLSDLSSSITEGVTVSYNGEKTFLVVVTNAGEVIVAEK